MGSEISLTTMVRPHQDLSFASRLLFELILPNVAHLLANLERTRSLLPTLNPICRMGEDTSGS